MPRTVQPPTPLELARALFDERWYPVTPGMVDDAFAEFIAQGPRADADPHPLFSLQHYLAQAPELMETGESPLLHFVREGWMRGLDPHPLFDTDYYARQYGHVMKTGEDPLTHYLRDGAAAGFAPCAWFDTGYYRHHNRDVVASGINPLAHFAIFGAVEGRRPNAEFDVSFQRQRAGLAPTANSLLHFLERLERVRTLARPTQPPTYSVIVLNFNKPLLTVQTVVDMLDDATMREQLEIIVVDNGSDPGNFAALRRELPQAARLFRLDANRFFGEGNNLGAELATAPYIVFLNNDAFLNPGALDALRRAFEEHPDCGAAGPLFLYPDGRVQEAGSMMSACGIALQRGKFLAPSANLYDVTEPVDYVSAACVMLRRETFDEIGGFDLAWDPAYYEDADMGFKIELLGKHVYYVPGATVVHMENTTSGDEQLALRMDGIVEVNREKFLTRWSNYLIRKRDPAAATLTLPSRLERPRTRPVAVFFTPYPLYPGGGERYLFTMAESLAPNYDVVVATPEAYSRWRIRTLARDLQLDLSHVIPIAQRDLERYGDCALFISMGNEMYPSIAAQGKRAIYHCQFPFPMSAEHVSANARHLAGYEAVVVNSEFTARHYRDEVRRYRDVAPPLHVIAPPVPMTPGGSEPRNPNRILHVGRFAPDGHSKRQDILVEAFRALFAKHPNVELHLAGTVPSYALARDYVVALRRDAMDLPVTFHLSIAPPQLEALYRTSAVYWHATGFGQPADLRPESQEHFGISIVEAMSAGVFPIVFDGGGPPEYITDGVDGALWESAEDLVERTAAFLDESPAEREERSAAARLASARFAVPFFRERFLAMLDERPTTSSNGVSHAAVVQVGH